MSWFRNDENTVHSTVFYCDHGDCDGHQDEDTTCGHVTEDREHAVKPSDLLAEVAAAADALAQAEARRLAACRAAFDAGIDRTEIAHAAGFDTRDGLYKMLRRRGR